MTGNLKKLPLDADQQARAIRGAILPVALHGCEILCPSPDRMASLRTVICETLVGQMPNAHRWMATSCLSTHNLDYLTLLSACCRWYDGPALLPLRC